MTSNMLGYTDSTFHTNLKCWIIARALCSGENKTVFRATHCKNIEDIRNMFSEYIKEWHHNDDRVILSLSFDGKKINAEWVEMNEYLEANK